LFVGWKLTDPVDPSRRVHSNWQVKRLKGGETR
jgi:hypothetical protein